MHQFKADSAQPNRGECLSQKPHSRARSRVLEEARLNSSHLKARLRRIGRQLKGCDLLTEVELATRLCSSSLEKTYLAQLAARMLGSGSESATLFGIGADLVMCAALTVDDWMDQASVRSGSEPLYSLYGPCNAVLTSVVLLEAAHLAVSDGCFDLEGSSRGRILQLFSRAVIGIQCGQELIARVDPTMASENEINALARLRCGRLIGFAMGSAGWCIAQPRSALHLTRAGIWIGIALQHRNDIQDFTLSFSQREKQPLADLLNGHPNIVLSHFFQVRSNSSDPARRRLLRLLGRARTGRQEQLTQVEFEEAVSAILDSGAAELAAASLSRSVEFADRALLELRMSTEALREWRDFAELLMTP